jgi:hypothetical protein
LVDGRKELRYGMILRSAWGPLPRRGHQLLELRGRAQVLQEPVVPGEDVVDPAADRDGMVESAQRLVGLADQRIGARQEVRPVSSDSAIAPSGGGGVAGAAECAVQVSRGDAAGESAVSLDAVRRGNELVGCRAATLT